MSSTKLFIVRMDRVLNLTKLYAKAREAREALDCSKENLNQDGCSEDEVLTTYIAAFLLNEEIDATNKKSMMLFGLLMKQARLLIKSFRETDALLTQQLSQGNIIRVDFQTGSRILEQ